MLNENKKKNVEEATLMNTADEKKMDEEKTEEKKTPLKEIEEITSADIGKEIVIVDCVRKVWPCEIKLQTGAFQCRKCGTIIMEEQTETEVRYPSECYKEQGGCGKEGGKSLFNLLSEKSKFINVQRIQIGSSSLNSSLKIIGILRGSLAGNPPSLYDKNIMPAVHVFLGTIQTEKTGKKTQNFNLYLEIFSFRPYSEARAECSTARAAASILDFLRDYPEGVTKNQIRVFAEQTDIGTDFFEKAIEKLKEEGKIFEKREGRYILV